MSLRKPLYPLLSSCEQIQKALSDSNFDKFFFFASLMMEEGSNYGLALAGHYWPASEMPFKWCFAGVLMMAQS